MRHICVRCLREGKRGVVAEDGHSGAETRGLCIMHALQRFKELRRVLTLAVQ